MYILAHDIYDLESRIHTFNRSIKIEKVEQVTETNSRFIHIHIENELIFCLNFVEKHGLGCHITDGRR